MCQRETPYGWDRETATQTQATKQHETERRIRGERQRNNGSNAVRQRERRDRETAATRMQLDHSKLAAVAAVPGQ